MKSRFRFRQLWRDLPDGGGEAHPNIGGLPHSHQAASVKGGGALPQEDKEENKEQGERKDN